MNLKFLISALSTFLLFSNLVLALPGIPNQFYGSVTLNGSPAPDGTTITAKINGVQVASTTTSGGKYGYEPIFYVSDPNSDRTGEEVVFFVNNVNTGRTSFFSNGGHTQLDLSASGGTSTPSAPPSGGPSGGVIVTGTSGTTTNGTQQEQTCHERWLCSEWSTCKDGIQTRTCADQNECGTNNDEPFTSQPCSTEEVKTSEQNVQNSLLLPTGFFLSLTAMEWATGIIIGIVAALIITFLILRNKHSVPAKLMEIKPLIKTKTSEAKPTVKDIKLP
jgi:hypothetical protein